MLNLDSYWEKITAKFLDGTCTHHGLPAGVILLTFCIQTVSSAIFFVVFMLTSSRRVCNQQLDPQAAAIGPVCLAGFAQVLQHVFGTHDTVWMMLQSQNKMIFLSRLCFNRASRLLSWCPKTDCLRNPFTCKANDVVSSAFDNCS